MNKRERRILVRDVPRQAVRRSMDALRAAPAREPVAVVVRTVVPERSRQAVRRSMDTVLPPGHRRRRLVKRAVLGPVAVGLVAREQQRRLGRRYRYLSRLQYPLIAVVALAMAFSATVGQWLLLVYALAVLLFRISSQQPFIGALLLLVAIPVFQLAGFTTFSQNAAIYAYELLVIGVVAAIVETSKKPHPKPS